MLQPVLLLALRLAGEQEAAVGRYYGDAVLPGAVAVGIGGQAGGGAVTVIFVPQEDLALGEGVLETHTQAAVWSRRAAHPNGAGVRVRPTSGSL